jgi:hypothetical protein
MRRAIEIIGNTANGKDVARLMLYFETDRVRNRLALDYYNATQSTEQTEQAA